MNQKIRIAFFLPTFASGGVQKVFINIAKNIDRAKFDPLIIVGKHEGPLAEHLSGDTEIHDLGGVNMRRAPIRLIRALRATGSQIVFSGTNSSNIASLTARCLMRQPPKTVIAEHTPMGIFLLDAKWRALRYALLRPLYRRADMIVVPLMALGEDLKTALKLPRLEIRELPNPVLDDEDIGRSYDRPRLPGLGARDPYFVSAGRLSPEKGFDLLIESFAGLAEAAPRPHLVILGDGPERGALSGLVRQRNLADRVHLPGYESQPARFFQHSLGYVMSSRREAVPNVVLEAMAAGAPVIATNCSYGPRALVDGGKIGLLVEPNSPQALADAMLQFVRDPAQAARFRELGYAQARRFTFKRRIPAFEQAFQDLLGAGTRAPGSCAEGSAAGAPGSGGSR